MSPACPEGHIWGADAWISRSVRHVRENATCSPASVCRTAAGCAPIGKTHTHGVFSPVASVSSSMLDSAMVFSPFKPDSLVVLRNRSAKITSFSESLRMTHENLPGLLRRKQR